VQTDEVVKTGDMGVDEVHFEDVVSTGRSGVYGTVSVV